MAKINAELRQALLDAELFPFATASPDGVPNVVPIKFLFVQNDEVLWLVDNFFNKTLENIRQNPHASLYVYRPERNLCVQIKGEIELKSSGTDFEEMRRRVHSTRPELPAKTLVVMRITDLFQCMPGPDAGAKLCS
ncbi:MAG: pyridoxamine 5'-phosphate oxidase family protein [Gammaproteobacteria bacterium]